jgi:hypothetical protein
MPDNPVNFALGLASAGIPLTTDMLQQLQTAVQGGAGTQSFIEAQSSVNDFYAWLGEMGSTVWIPDTDADGNPVYFAAQRSGENDFAIIVSATLDPGVIDGDDPPAQFTFNGENYYTVGVLTATQSYNGTPLWKTTIPLGVATVIPKQLLSSYSIQVLKVLMSGLAKGISSCFKGAQSVASGDDVQDAADQGAEDAAVDGAEVEGTSVSLAAGAAAMAGFVVLAVVPILLNVFSHQTFQSLLIYNLTPYDIVWTIAYQDEGTLVAAPLTGAGSTAYNDSLPALTTPAAGDLPLMSSAVLGFASTNELSGIGYVLSATFSQAGTTIPAGTFIVLFDIPFDGDNSLSIQTNAAPDVQTWYDQNAGTFQQTQVSAGDDLVSATATFDFLSGEHPAPTGLDMYWYNSVLVFQPATASVAFAGVGPCSPVS